MQLILTADRLIGWLSNAFAAVAAVLLGLMAVIGTADVIAFNVLGAPVPAANEMASALLPITVMLAMSYAQRRDAHIRVDILSQLLPASAQRALQIVYLLVGAAVFMLVAWASWELALKSVAISERAIAAVRFPVWPVKVVFAFGASVVTLQLLSQLVRSLWPSPGRPLPHEGER